MVYYVFSSEKLLINHPLDSIVDLRVCPLPVRNWALQLARQPGWPMEGSGGEAQAVGAPASWLFQAVSLPHRHQACLRDQGHRKRGSFPVFLLFLCEPLFRRATLPNGGREQSRFVWEWIGMKEVWRILRWEWRGKVCSVDNRRVDENFEMGWRGNVFFC